MFELRFVPSWDKHYSSLDKSIKIRILKKLDQLKAKEKSRHLGLGLPFFVEEVGQYRIVFKQDDVAKIKEIYFIGDHKQYQDWYSSFGF